LTFPTMRFAFAYGVGCAVLVGVSVLLSPGRITPPLLPGNGNPRLAYGDGSAARLSPGRIRPPLLPGNGKPRLTSGEGEGSALSLSPGGTTPPLLPGKGNPPLTCGGTTPPLLPGKGNPPLTCGGRTPPLLPGKCMVVVGAAELKVLIIVIGAAGAPKTGDTARRARVTKEMKELSMSENIH